MINNLPFPNPLPPQQQQQQIEPCAFGNKKKNFVGKS